MCPSHVVGGLLLIAPIGIRREPAEADEGRMAALLIRARGDVLQLGDGQAEREQRLGGVARVQLKVLGGRHLEAALEQAVVGHAQRDLVGGRLPQQHAQSPAIVGVLPLLLARGHDVQQRPRRPRVRPLRAERVRVLVRGRPLAAHVRSAHACGAQQPVLLGHLGPAALVRGAVVRAAVAVVRLVARLGRRALERAREQLIRRTWPTQRRVRARQVRHQLRVSRRA
eukprot:1102964-Prymnesium_polylepis.1